MRSKYIYIKIYTVIIIENYTYLQSCCNFECENMVCVVRGAEILAMCTAAASANGTLVSGAQEKKINTKKLSNN